MESDRFSNESARIGEFRRRIARHVQCRSCGFEPPKEGTPPSCPKCKGSCWETFVRVGKLRPAPSARPALS
jgi:predicted Zn-ribbon and HTH transcriptional regulator